MKNCDNASVGILIKRSAGGRDEWLMIELAKPPAGIAPVAGHVFDDHKSYEAAAVAEVREEIGLRVVSLVDTGIGGWRDNRCQREPGPRGTGHDWRIYLADVTGDLALSADEAAAGGWLRTGAVAHLAARTATYAIGDLSRPFWNAAPGLEPVWCGFLAQLGLFTLAPRDLAAIEHLANTGEPW